MARVNDPLGDLVKDFAIALALSYVPAQIWASFALDGGMHPVTGLIAMVTTMLVHGWLVVATWHGKIALVVLLLALFLVGRFVRPVGWVRCLAFLTVLVAWGAYAIISPELLGDGLSNS